MPGTQMKQFSIIVAVAKNNAIGLNNQLLWHIPEDFKWFKKITSGSTVIMGKKTYFSLPKRPLPNRRNIVISDIPGEIIEGAEMAYSIDGAIEIADMEKENFIIGGASIYQQFFTKAQKLYITHVNKEFEADTYFPVIEPSEWDEIQSYSQQETHPKGLEYTFKIYTRKV
jgi:dihydrofolate reductase